MCEHYGFCSGDSSFATFKCPHCHGVVTSQALLQLHIAASHSVLAQPSTLPKRRIIVTSSRLNVIQDEVVGREEEYPLKMEVDDIAASLTQDCSGQGYEPDIINSDEVEDTTDSPSSSYLVSDHNYTYQAADNPATGDSDADEDPPSPIRVKPLDRTVHYAEELTLIERIETAYTLAKKIAKNELASISTCLSPPFISPKSVRCTTVATHVSENVKSKTLESEQNSIPTRPFNSAVHTEASQETASSASKLLEATLLRRTVITDGRLINRTNASTVNSDINASQSDLLFEREKDSDILVNSIIGQKKDPIDSEKVGQCIVKETSSSSSENLRNNLNVIENLADIDKTNQRIDNAVITNESVNPLVNITESLDIIGENVESIFIVKESTNTIEVVENMENSVNATDSVDNIAQTEAVKTDERRDIIALPIQSLDVMIKTEIILPNILIRTSICDENDSSCLNEPLITEVEVENEGFDNNSDCSAQNEPLITDRERENEAVDNHLDNTSVCSAQNEHSLEISYQPKRKRGRPRKEKPDVNLKDKIIHDTDESFPSNYLNKKSGRRRQSGVDVVENPPSQKRFLLSQNVEEDPVTDKLKRKKVLRARRLSSSDDSDVPLSQRASEKRPHKKVRARISSTSSSENEEYVPGGSPPVPVKIGRPSKYAKVISDCNTSIEKVKKVSKLLKDAKKSKTKKPGPERTALTPENSFKCGKCEVLVAKKEWEEHNALEHVGLAWTDGEPPVDQCLLDSEELLIRLRGAFKFRKSAPCELCGVEKKSFLGLQAHMMTCGRSLEKQEQSLAKCELCGKMLKPYSMATHLRVHEPSNVVEVFDSLPKRRSAIKAISHLQKAMGSEKKSWIHYRKGDVLPEVNFRLDSKDPSEPRNILCIRENCNMATNTPKRALKHFFSCPTVPEKYFQCLDCSYFDTNEETITAHCEQPHGGGEDDYDIPTESDEDQDHKRKRDRPNWRSKQQLSKDEFALRKQFTGRENMLFKTELYKKAIEEEMARQSSIKNDVELYSELHTCREDWIRLEEPGLSSYLPPLHTSLPVRRRLVDKVTEFHKLKQFESRSTENLTVGFAGGIVQNLAWCPISLARSSSAHQYLAVSVANQIETSPRIRSNTTTNSLLQIWDCGMANSNSNTLDSLEMSLGIAMDDGELWDLTWSPHDAWQEGSNNKLPRIGLIAAAFHDGAVRIYSISCPEPVTKDKVKIYKVPPVALLKPSYRSEQDPCLRLSWGLNGALCGGHRSGQVSLWRLQQLKSRHTSKQSKTVIISSVLSFQAHPYSITAMALCPSNSRLLATGADKRMFVWDLMTPLVPLRMENGSPTQKLQWMSNWPGLFYIQDDYTVSLDVPPHFVVPRSSFRTNSCVNDVSFSDWCYVTGAVNMAGEVFIHRNQDPLQEFSKARKFKTVITKVIVNSTNNQEKRNNYNTYADLEENFGITFSDFNPSEGRNYAEKTAENPSYAKYFGNAVKKVAFNPNYRVFHHVAIGLHTGFIRIMRLNYLENAVNKLVSSHEEKH